MAIKIDLSPDEYAALDETLREEYEEWGDGYRLSDALANGFESESEIAGLKKALEREREAVRSLKGEVTAFREKLEGAEQGQRESDLTAMQREMAAMRKSTEIRDLLDRHGGNPALLRSIVESQTRISESGVLEVVDSEGNPRLGEDGKPMSADALVSAMRESSDYAGAFRGINQHGSGAEPGGLLDMRGGRPNVTRSAPASTDLRNASVEEKRAYLEKFGRAAYIEATQQ